MRKRSLMIGFLALGGFGCEQRGADPVQSGTVSTSATAPATTSPTAAVADAGAVTAREVKLKLPGMV